MTGQGENISYIVTGNMWPDCVSCWTMVVLKMSEFILLLSGLTLFRGLHLENCK